MKTFLRPLIIIVFGLWLTTMLAGCTPASPVATPVAETPSGPSYAGKKIVYVNSYHQGYAWSDGIESGLHEILDGTGVELKIIRLDAKRNPDAAFIKDACLKAIAEIDAFKPDLIIASDDIAQKYLIVPYYKDSSIPIIFNGVNWTAEAYGYPTGNMTGMIEVELPDQLIELLKGYAKGERLGYITFDSETERKVVDIYNDRFFEGDMQPYWVKTLDEFKTSFLNAQKELDILFMGNNAGADKWDQAEMEQFVLDNTTIPTGSINDWMAPYSLLTLAKSSKEQGLWSAQTALNILAGTPAKDIPVVENKKGEIMVNLDLADKLGVVFAPSLLKNAIIIDKQP